MKPEEAIERIELRVRHACPEANGDNIGECNRCWRYPCNDMKAVKLLAQKQKGEWSGEPERRKMVTRVCAACGERSAVGYYCMWCGAQDGVSPKRDEKVGDEE